MAEKTSQGLNLYNYMTDKNRDIYDGTFGKTDGTNPSSMEVINNFMENKLTLNGEKSKQNFNFIENKVVQDGLVGFETISSSKQINLKYNQDFTVMIITDIYDLFDMAVEDFFYPFSNIGINPGNSIQYGIRNKNMSSFLGKTYSLKRGLNPVNDLIVLTNTKDEIKLNMCDTILSDKSPQTDKSVLVGNYSAGYVFKNNSKLKIIYYNRILTPTEIQHNFSVLNNSPSINQLQVTDSANQTSILSLGSTEDAVEMASGRTLREEYMGVLEGMSQEYTSTGGAITVNDGLKARLVGAEIQGNTAKNMFPTEGVITLQGTLNVMSDRIVLLKNTNMSTNTKYTIITFIESNSLVQDFIVCHAHPTSIWQGSNILIPPKSIGVFKHTATTKTDFTGIANAMRSIIGAGGSETGSVSFRQVILEGDYSNVNPPISSYIPFGLTSTVATISNNGIKYPFYQQYVEGETVVQKRAKGSSNEWVTIPQDETRDTVANEYRLYSANGLGSVPSVEDVVDLASGVKTENTKEIVLNGSESWILGTSKTNTTLFYITLSDSIRDPSIKATSNMFNYLASNWAVDSVSFEIASNGRLHVNISNSIATTLQQFKTWLTSNVITVRYQLATPTTIQLTDAQLATYSPYKKQILLNGGGSIKDVLRLNSDGSLSCENKIIERYVDGSAIKSVNTDLTNTAYITLTFNDGTINQSNVFIMSKLYNRNEYIYNQDVVGVFLEGPSYPVRYRLPKSIVGTSIEEVKQYFNLNPDTIRYSLQTPTITTIPKEVNTPVLTNQSNVLSAGEAVSASSFAVKLPTTSSIKKQYAQTLLNNYTGTASANLLKDGRVQIDMTVTIPTTFNQTVFSLPTELRPKVARKVMGFNGNNPVTLLVGTDGTVKIPTTITGTVELCDEYVL